MVRYTGESLPASPRLAVVANDAIGNFVIGTPLMRMLRDRWNPAALDHYGGARTLELAENSALVDEAVQLHGPAPKVSMADLAAREPYDLVVNLEQTPMSMVATAVLAGDLGAVVGPCVGKGGRERLPFADDERGRLAEDKHWKRETICEDYPFLDSGYIGEIFCRLAYLDGPIPRYELPTDRPTRSIPDVLIACSASLPDKLWTTDKWIEAVQWLRDGGLTIGLLGAPPAKQKEFWKGSSLEDDLVATGMIEDLRGAFTLPEVVGALQQARLVLTLDNGILHLACAGSTPTVGLFRYGIHRLWAPPVANLTVLHALPEEVVADIAVETVVNALESAVESGA